MRPGKGFKICNYHCTFLKMNPQSENVDFQSLSSELCDTPTLRPSGCKTSMRNKSCSFSQRRGGGGWFHSSSTKWQRRLTNIPSIKYLLISSALVFIFFSFLAPVNNSCCVTGVLSTHCSDLLVPCCLELFLHHVWSLFCALIHFGSESAYILYYGPASLNTHTYGRSVGPCCDSWFSLLSSGQLYICPARHPEKSQGPGGAGQQDWWWVFCLASIHPSIKCSLLTALPVWFDFHLLFLFFFSFLFNGHAKQMFTSLKLFFLFSLNSPFFVHQYKCSHEHTWIWHFKSSMRVNEIFLLQFTEVLN